MIGPDISHYKITAKLGEGGMGVVYKATDTKLERTVALKFLARHMLSNDEAKKRFVREAKAAAALDHPNICTVHEIDEADGETFIAMAFLEGRTLADAIAAGPLKLADVIDITTQTAKGLREAHGKGIFHRDIKPSNMVLIEKGAKERLVKIMDFGLAHLTDRSKLTEDNTTLGTPAYMSPEQAQGIPVDRRTDIWALGVVLYEMIVGEMPFPGEYPQAILYSILHEEYEPLTARRAGVPLELEWIVEKCLAKEAEDRYQDMESVLVDLANLKRKLESGKSTIARPVKRGVGGKVGPAREPVPTGGGPARVPVATGELVAAGEQVAAGEAGGGAMREAGGSGGRFGGRLSAHWAVRSGCWGGCVGQRRLLQRHAISNRGPRAADPGAALHARAR